MSRRANSFLESAFHERNAFQSLLDTREWLKELQSSSRYTVEQVRFDQLRDWTFEAGTANLRHASGRFFSVEGIDCQPGYYAPPWRQPIIHQPEIGILGIVTKEFGGVRYFLMQAKMEPGNVNLVQLSPTVQATRSNYTQAHGGRLPPYLEYFLGGAAAVIHDELQSETGTRFYRKYNRNMVVEAKGEVQLLPGFRWLTLGEIQTLMAEDNLVNMDSRSVLSNLDYGEAAPGQEHAGDFLRSAQCASGAAQSMAQLRAWLAAMRKKYAIATRRIPLKEVSDWCIDEWGVRHREGRFFSVVGVAVQARDREVAGWGQPLLRHEELGLAGFLCQRINGVLHFLLQAKPEPGIAGSVELAPTVSVSDYRNRLGRAGEIPFFHCFVEPAPARLRYQTIQSEEGGRFWNLQNRFMVVEVREGEAVTLPERYRWMTLAQLREFCKGESRVNSEARTLLACLKFNIDARPGKP